MSDEKEKELSAAKERIKVLEDRLRKAEIALKEIRAIAEEAWGNI